MSRDTPSGERSCQLSGRIVSAARGSRGAPLATHPTKVSPTASEMASFNAPDSSS